MTARVTFREEDGCYNSKTFDYDYDGIGGRYEDLADKVLDWVETEAGREIDTDGYGYWWTDGDGEQHTVLQITDITDITED